MSSNTLHVDRNFVIVCTSYLSCGLVHWHFGNVSDKFTVVAHACCDLQATLVRNTTDEQEGRILYEYLAEASVVFPRVFPVM